MNTELSHIDLQRLQRTWGRTSSDKYGDLNDITELSVANDLKSCR